MLREYEYCDSVTTFILTQRVIFSQVLKGHQVPKSELMGIVDVGLFKDHIICPFCRSTNDPIRENTIVVDYIKYIFIRTRKHWLNGEVAS